MVQRIDKIEIIKESLSGTNYSNPLAIDVKRDFKIWYKRPQYIAAIAKKESFLPPSIIHSDEPYKTINNHFQGIQRLNHTNGNYFIISGGSKDYKHSHLFVIEIGSHTYKSSPIGTNLLLTGQPFQSDALKQVICLEKDEYWHAGGISICGDILTVPLENDSDSSKIIFLNFQDLEKPKQYKNLILREKTKAGAATLLHLANGYFLCAVWTEANGHRFDFYLSNEPKITAGFHQLISVEWEDIKNKSKHKPRFQGIHFIREENAVYLIGTRSTSFFAPVFGKDNAHLFKIHLPDETQLNDQTSLNKVVVELIATRSFDGGCKYYDMGAAGGPFVNENGRVFLYSGHHWRHDECIRFAEFTPCLDPKDIPIKTVKDTVIELYENSNFDENCLKVYGHSQTKIVDYKNIFVQEKDFHHKVSSARIHLPRDYSYILYSEPRFKGKRLILRGDEDGKVRRFPNIGKLFNDKVASSKLVKNGTIELDK